MYKNCQVNDVKRLVDPFIGCCQNWQEKYEYLSHTNIYHIIMCTVPYKSLYNKIFYHNKEVNEWSYLQFKTKL